jgi:hypothetical protein
MKDSKKQLFFVLAFLQLINFSSNSSGGSAIISNILLSLLSQTVWMQMSLPHCEKFVWVSISLLSNFVIFVRKKSGLS